ncbi:MAG: 3-hydroxylacyl-ACP dehydratase [Acidiferrobacterales bacterium]
MCLLDCVESWDQTAITCNAISHADVSNPLRQYGRLHAICGVEYAAQAMAVHAGLTFDAPGERPALGFLASVRNLELFVDRIDTVGPELRIEARRLSDGERSFIYQFDMWSGPTLLLSGRAAVILAKGIPT